MNQSQQIQEAVEKRSVARIEKVDIAGIAVPFFLVPLRPRIYFRLCEIVKELKLDDTDATSLFLQFMLVDAEGNRVYPDLVVKSGKIDSGGEAFAKLCDLDYAAWSPLNEKVYELMGMRPVTQRKEDPLKNSDAIRSDTPH